MFNVSEVFQIINIIAEGTTHSSISPLGKNLKHSQTCHKITNYFSVYKESFVLCFFLLSVNLKFFHLINELHGTGCQDSSVSLATRLGAG
jgi:hypothetical protein